MTADPPVFPPTVEVLPAMSPQLVALLRGALEAAVLAVIGVAAAWLTSADLGPWAAFGPAGVLALRALEGVADARIDPTRQRAPLGGRPELEG